MLHTYHSNRLEVLLDHLIGVIADPLADPMTPERVVVQHPGMGRWLGQELARRTGIAANLELPLPAAALWDLLGHWIPDLPERSQWERGPLTWRLFGLLQGLASDPELQIPAHYLQGEPHGLKTYQLARRLADLFDQYLVYRADLVLDWECRRQPLEDPAAAWQARLWRELATRIGSGPESRHRAALFRALEQLLEGNSPPVRALPERLLVFGLSALPPLYTRLIGRLADWIPTHLFVLSPCREYWADLVDEGHHARVRARDLAKGVTNRATLLDVGNPLLASWGRAGKAFQDALIELQGADTSDYREPSTARLLGLVQWDLLHAHDRRTPHPEQRTLLAPGDDSLLIHACHSPQRELEVLQDRLLRLFETRPDLRPRDILVMAPDIDPYAPLIGAVFGAVAEGDPRAIPYAIADRPLVSEHPLLAALESLLGLPDSRLGVTEVLTWLGVPAIARRFGLSESDLARVRVWVAETGIRWGQDGPMRARLGLPGEEANTWRFGLRRLFLGYALPPEERLYGDSLPYPDLEGPEAEALGGLQGFVEALARWRVGLAEPRPLKDWCSDLNRLLTDLMEPDEEEETLLQPLRRALEQLRADAETADFDGPVGRDCLREELGAWLAGGGSGQRFLTGRVTFCSMVPLRSIPARVLCVLGLNGSDFPRDLRPPAFDLMAAAPRPGDRARREDDRQLFLEALLSARDCLHLSYRGRDQRDNAPKVPSVLIDELLAYIRGAFRFPAQSDAKTAPDPADWLVVPHPLQPFSRRYFDGADPRLFSYRQDWCQAARSRPEPGCDRFITGPLAPTREGKGAVERSPETLEIQDLIRFLRDPPGWFLSHRLGLRAAVEDQALEETEPFTLKGLEAWGLRQRLLGLVTAGRESEASALLRASGLLPHGLAGELTYEHTLDRVVAFRARLAPYAGEVSQPLELELEVAGLRLVGWLKGLTGQGLVAQRLGRIRAVDRLALWVRHLALNLAAPPGVPTHSVLVGESETLKLLPVACPAENLEELIGLFLLGQHEPIPLFPETSLAMALDGGGKRVTEAWQGGRSGRPGEGDGAAVRTAFRGSDPLGSSFVAVASLVFGPLLAATEPEAP